MKKKTNQKKLIVSRLHKRFAITILIILLLSNIGLIIKEVMIQETTEESQVLSSVSNTPGITYKVYLKENALFDEAVQPEDIGYFSTLIDHIEVIFDNKYQGDNGTEYKGDYTVTGEITGWEGGAEEPTPAWTKNFNISSKKTFRTTDGQLLISQNVNINYNHFNNYITQFAELTGYNASCTMIVTMTINYIVATDEGEVTGSLQPSLLIPLGEKYFKIIKSGNEEIKNDITKTVEVPVPVDYLKISLFSTISLLCLILLSLFISSAEPTQTDLQRKRIRKLLKSHGNRIVAIENDSIYSNLEVCYVHSMDDMIKISDEIERPILHVFVNDPADIDEFFIIEREKAYLFKIPVCQFEKKKDSEKAEASSESGDSDAAVTV